jgi:hypothetical protein
MRKFIDNISIKLVFQVAGLSAFLTILTALPTALNGPRIEQLFSPIIAMRIVALDVHKLSNGMFFVRNRVAADVVPARVFKLKPAPGLPTGRLFEVELSATCGL